MHDRELSALITKLNSGRGKQVIVRVAIAPHVDYAKVWTRPQQPLAPPVYTTQPYTFYFVKDAQQRYVSCIHDAHSDLHWYTSRPHRGKGYLKRALAEVVIPHILGRRDELVGTIQARDARSEGASIGLARSLGFVPATSEVWRYAPERRPEPMPHPIAPMDEPSVALLRSRLHQAKEVIRAAAEELALHYGDRFRIEDLTNLSERVGAEADMITDTLLNGSVEELDH
jgi:hypothetical protein